MASTFTIYLLKLECLGAQEIDGDETYLKVGGTVHWRSAPDKMHHLPEFEEHVAEYDFDTGRKRVKAGWVAMTPYNPETFILRGCENIVNIQVWDSDTLTSDESFGETPIDASQAASGEISVLFQRDGGNYRLTYRVEDA